MNLSGARPRGPRPDLDNKDQLALLHHLHELNQPYRVSYEMIVRNLWSDNEDSKLRRARAKDLSRQFRGEKLIEWKVIESYATLLYPQDPALKAQQLDTCHTLHLQAFGQPAGKPEHEPRPPAAVDPEYVADLERQLAETRMRATFATALLVIVRAENAALRGKSAHFAWFESARTVPAAKPTTTEVHAEPFTTPITRRSGLHSGQIHRRVHPSVAFGSGSTSAESPGRPQTSLPAPPAAHTAAPHPPRQPSSAIAGVADSHLRRIRESGRGLAPVEVTVTRRAAHGLKPEPGPDILVGRERRRKGKGR